MLLACHFDFTIIMLVLGFTLGGLGLRQGFTKIAQICPKLVILLQPPKC